jgi:hypothetical protein
LTGLQPVSAQIGGYWRGLSSASRLCSAMIVKHRQAGVPEREHPRRRAWLPDQDQ